MKINTLFNIIALIGIGIIITSCSGVKITADYDTSADFTKYKTFEYYGWAKESDKLMNDLDKKRIEDAFANEFYSRGMSYVKEGGDLVVTLFIVVENKTQQTASTTSMGGGYGGYGGYYGHGPGWGYGGGYSSTTISEHNYQVGTLVCDVYDKKAETLLWEGIANKEIEQNVERRAKTIPYIIGKMMEKYPVPELEEK